MSKVVAAQRGCSRSQAEQYIAEGWVKVSGRVVEEPQFRVAGEPVEIDPLAQLGERVAATFFVHKPVGIGTQRLLAGLGAANRWAGDDSGLRRLASHGVNLVELMPLPPQASGLAVFSQDRRIVRKLQEDEATLEQELLAEVAGEVSTGKLARLCRGLVFEGQPLPQARVSQQSEARLRFAVKGIAPHWIEWMCAQVGLELLALRRIRLGRLPLAGLPAGQWRYLRPDERF